MLRIELIDPKIDEIADRILSGDLPPITGDREVIQEIARRVAGGEIQVEFFRREGSKEICYNPTQVAILAERWPEPRPIKGF